MLKKIIKKIGRIFLALIAGVLFLNIALYIVFSIPSVQKRAALFALERLQPMLGTELGLRGIRVKLFNSVELQGLYVGDQRQDTLLYVDRLLLQFSARDLLRNNVSVHRLLIEDFTANVNRDTPDEPFNFQFIIDAFAGEPDTVAVSRAAPSWHVTVGDLMLRNGTLRYNVFSEPETPYQFNANHLSVQDFTFRASVNFRSPQNMNVDIRQLTLLEANSGLSLNDFSGRIIGQDSIVSSNAININVNNTYLSLSNIRFNTENQAFTVSVECEADPQDVHLVVPIFAHLEHPVSLAFDAHGQLPAVSLTSFNLTYGAGLSLDLTASLADIRAFETSDLDLVIHNLSVSQEELQAIIRIGRDDFESPEQLWALGDIYLQLTAKGSLNYFQYDGAIQIEHGDIALSGIGKIQDNFDRMSFDGPVSVKNVRVSGIIGEEPGVEYATVHTNAKVLITDDPIEITASGTVESAYFRNFRYENIHFTSHIIAGDGVIIEANVHTDTEFNAFNLDANLAFGDKMQFIVYGTTNRLDLRPLFMRQDWQMPTLSAHIDINMSGETFDNMIGSVALDNISLADEHFVFNPGLLYLQMSDIGAGNQRIELMTAFLELTLEGDYAFTTIGNELMYALRPHLPSVITEEQARLTESARSNFTFNVLLRNTEDISAVFSLPFYNVETATISGSVNMPDNESITVRSHLPRFIWNGNDMRETRLAFNSSRETAINLDINTYLSQERGFINARLQSEAANDMIEHLLGFELNNIAATSNGELLITMDFLRTLQNELISTTHIHPASIVFNDTSIDFNEATITQRQNHIKISNFGLRENDILLLGIEGIASNLESEHIYIFFHNTELLNILSAFNIVNFTGAINGGVYISQALQNPRIRTENLRIDHITAHNDTIGTLFLNGSWDNAKLGLDIDAFLVNDEGVRNMEVVGFIPTGDESPYRMGVQLRIDGFDLFTILPFATDIFSELAGTLHANINLTGTLAEPITEGWVEVRDGRMRVAYTNVTYYVSDRIQISPDNVGLNNIEIRDPNGNTALLNVRLDHTNFGHVRYTATITLNDFMLLNNARRTDLMVYGNLRLSGNLHVVGSPSGIFGEGDLRPSSRSSVTVAIPRIASADEYSGVIFINTSQPTDTLAFAWQQPDAAHRTNATMPIVMRVNLQLNELLEAGVILDPVTNNALRNVRGDGDLSLRFDSRASTPVTIFGDYTIQEGEFYLNLQNIFNIDFNIREGSTLTMRGDPLSTQFNITAYHPTRADLAVLHHSFGDMMANSRVRANAILQISGSMERLDLTPTIEIPDVTTDIQHRVLSFMPSEEAKMQQFIYLAALGTFWPSDGTPNLFGGGGQNIAMQLGANMLSRTLDAMFANVIGSNWRVGTRLESQDGAFDNMRMGVDVSGRLLNNRLIVSANASYSEQRMATQQAFMGEFEVEYVYNAWLRFRAYSRTNDQMYRRAPSTQGIGAVVTREARTFENLFRFRRRQEE